jgi:hypothetical protein
VFGADDSWTRTPKAAVVVAPIAAPSERVARF